MKFVKKKIYEKIKSSVKKRKITRIVEDQRTKMNKTIKELNLSFKKGQLIFCWSFVQ